MITTRPRPWTVEDVEALKRLAAEGVFVPAIAKQLNRTQTAVQERSRLLGLSVKSSAQRRRMPETSYD